MSYEYYDSLSGEAKVRYDKKLYIIGIKECPFKLAADMWTNDPTKWPELQWPKIVTYLIDQQGIFTRETMKNYRALEAYKTFFLSGWVRTVLHIWQFRTQLTSFLSGCYAITKR